MRNLKKTVYFTLLELLLVIAVIAILSSLLLPALSKAKETSRAAACQGNLKQFAYGAIQYSSDYNDYTLTYITYGYPTLENCSWFITLGPYLGLGNSSSEIFQRYTTQNTLYTCPSHRWREGLPNIRGYWGRGYGINYHFASNGTTDYFLDGGLHPKTSMVKYPSSLIYFLETDNPLVTTSFQNKIYGDLSAWKMSDGGYFVEKNWHNGYPNQLYFDGHIGKAKWYSIPGTMEGDPKIWRLNGIASGR